MPDQKILKPIEEFEELWNQIKDSSYSPDIDQVSGKLYCWLLFNLMKKEGWKNMNGCV
jgi:hypothetical protein